MFRRDTLATVIEEFNRYNTSPRFELDDAAISDRHYSGEFDADDPESLLQLLAADAKLSVVRRGDVVVVGKADYSVVTQRAHPRLTPRPDRAPNRE